MRNIDLSRVENKEVGHGIKYKMVPGGYVCEIMDVVDVPEQEYLKVSFDVVEGEYAGFYAARQQRFGNGLATYYASYRQDNLPQFKAFITAVQHSNPTYTWNNNEKTLIHKKVGMVIGEKEFQRNPEDAVGIALKPRWAISVDRVRNGDFDIPPLQKMSKPNHDKHGRRNDGRHPAMIAAQMSMEEDTDLPF